MEREQPRDVEKRPVDIAVEKSQRISEELQEDPDAEVEFTRYMFGEGFFGERIYNVFSQGVYFCELRIDGRETCENRGVTTVDYDVRGEEDYRIVCGNEHAKEIRDRIKQDLDRYGERGGTFGRNGFGRG